MVCKNCGNDRYNVIKVYRNRRLKDGRFKVNDYVDSRMIICKYCGSRYISESKVTYEILYKNYKSYCQDVNTSEESQLEIDYD